MQKLLAGFAAVAATFVAQAATYDVEAGDVDRVIELAATAPGDSIINLAAGVYDFSQSTTNNPSYGAILVTPSGRTLHFRGAGTKHWSEKTRAEETVLIGHGKYALFYGVNGGSRCSKFYNLTFECCTNTAGVAAAGAIAMTANECYASTPPGFATNCVFRNCYSSKSSGGATSYLSAYDCLYTNCVSTSGGGGAYGGNKTISGSSNPSTNCFVKCTFVDCQAPSGGGLYCDAYNCVRDCTFVGCRATGTGGHGGGLYVAKAADELVGCTFVSNSSAKANGGGLMLASSLHRLADCTFVGNSAERGDGGAVRCSSADSVVDVEFTNNSSTNGGAFYSSARLTDMARCSFVSNWSSKICGSMNCSGYTRISACVFSNNVAAVDNAGIYAGYYPDAGTVENCVFYNNTNRFANVGSQISGAANVIGCTFGGYGDYTRVKNYDRCVFDGCSFDYDDYGSGMIVFDTTTMEGHVRNCLFKNNNVHIYIKNAVGSNVEIANCTFVGNSIIKAWNARGNQWSDGFLFYSFRGGTDPNDSKKQLPSTNIVVNCTFADNTRDGARNDVNFYVTGTSVATSAVNVFSNSVYEIASFVNNPTIQGNLIVGRAKFTAGDPKYGDDVPYYMPKRNSPARKAGLWLDWMAGAKDLAGVDMPSAAPVDLGCYQCTLPSLGLLLLLR